MKKLLITFIFLCFGLFTFAQFAEAPQYNFSSTSTHEYIECQQHYTIPLAEIQKPFYNPNTQNKNIRKAPGFPPADPGWEETPIGESILPLLVISLSYCLSKLFKQHKI